MLENADRNSIFSGDVNSSWEEWRARFMQVMNHCIPQLYLKSRKKTTLALKTSHPSNAEKERLVPCSQEESKYSLISEVQGSKEQGCCTASTEQK